MKGIVYVLTNASMPTVVKIGRTTRKNLEPRMKELYNTSVPERFQCAYAVRVEDAAKVERALHDAFGNQRPNSNREFFEIGADSKDGANRVRAILKILVDLYGAEDVTPEVKESLTKSRNPRREYKLLDMGIPPDSELTFATGKNEKTDKIAKVASNKTVYFDGKEMELLDATRLAYQQETGENLPTDRPMKYWYHGDSWLRKIRRKWADDLNKEELYGDQDSKDK